jgi:hypothetical protein
MDPYKEFTFGKEEVDYNHYDNAIKEEALRNMEQNMVEGEALNKTDCVQIAGLSEVNPAQS